MFISKAEKELLFFRIEQLTEQIESMKNTIKNIKFASTFESEIKAKPSTDRRSSNFWTEERRKAQSEFAKAMWAKKKAKT